jgi:hypothetical protein
MPPAKHKPIILKIYATKEDLLIEDTIFKSNNSKVIYYDDANNKDELMNTIISPISLSQTRAHKKFNSGFRYISANNWNKKTNLRCWWCTYQFSSTPVGIPFSYDDEKFKVLGCFCSFNCAYAYIINKINDKKWEKVNLLKNLYSQVFKVSDEPNFQPTPSHELFKDYGGALDINDWRQKSEYKKISYEMIIPPIISIGNVVSEKDLEKSYKELEKKNIIGLGSNIDDGKGGNVYAKKEVNNSSNIESFRNLFMKT